MGPIIFLLVTNAKANFTFLKTLGMQIDFLQRDLLYTLQQEIGTAAPAIFPSEMIEFSSVCSSCLPNKRFSLYARSKPYSSKFSHHAKISGNGSLLDILTDAKSATKIGKSARS
jgi:hypothetical protein